MAEDENVIDNHAAHRFEFAADGHRAVLTYTIDGALFTLVHTVVPDELGGRGVGGLLVRAAVDRAVADGLTIVPHCPFARSWLEKHPDIAASVDIDW